MTIELQQLTTGYHTRRGIRKVAEHISATLRVGELTCLLGPNGAGKSTLLRTLAAFQPPLEGDIVLDGRSLASYSSHELSTRIGIVLTERPDVQGMRVREMVAMGRSPYTGFWGRLTDKDEAAVSEAIAQVGIGALERRMIHTLSDGERQKVMIAKTLAQQTPVIFLDEPTAFLDFPSKVEMLLLLARLAHDMQKTIFLSTHDVELALQTADRLWLMGTPRDTATGPQAATTTSSIIIGTPSQLAADGTLPRFFAGPGITFDAHAQRFLINKSH